MALELDVMVKARPKGRDSMLRGVLAFSFMMSATAASTAHLDFLSNGEVVVSSPFDGGDSGWFAALESGLIEIEVNSSFREGLQSIVWKESGDIAV